MIRKFKIQNYFSFLDEQTLDLSIARNATDPDSRFARPIEDQEDRFPKVVALFGANASGKTNLLKSFSFLQSFVTGSADWPRDEIIPILSFMSDAGKSMPTKFSVEFDMEILPNIGRQKFLYELELVQGENKVGKEALYYYPQGRQRRLFERNNDEIQAGLDFKLRAKDPIREKLRSNASVISTLAKFNHAFSLAIFNNIKSIQTNVTVMGKFEHSVDRATNYYESIPECLEALIERIRSFDFGIENVLIKSEYEKNITRFKHAGLASEVILAFESQGTVNFYKIFPAIWYALKAGTLVVLDELDNDIHPLILPEIVKLFQSPETNPHDAQLIMSCHDATLLESLSKEEVFFTEKDEQGRTSVFGLSDIKGVRRDTNIYAKYLAGVFGAIPRLA